MASTYELIVKAVDRSSGPLRSIENSLKRIEKQANRTGRQMDGIGGRKGSAGIGAIAGAVSRLPGPLLLVGTAGAAAAAGLNKIVEAGSELQQLRNRLSLVTGSAEETTQQLDRLRKMAVSNRTAFKDTVDLFSNLAVSTEDLGFSTQKVEQLTTKLSQALAVAGADAVTTSSVIRQFGQAMASGTVRGDEFNSLVEGLGPALSIMARESGITVGELRKMSQAGELTAEKMAELLLNSNSLSESFNKMEKTLPQARQELDDAFDKFASDLDESFKITVKLTRALQLLSKAMTAGDTSLPSIIDPNDLEQLNGFAANLTSQIAELEEKIEGFGTITNQVGQFGDAIGLSAFSDRVAEIAQANALLELFKGQLDSTNKAIEIYLRNQIDAAGATGDQAHALTPLIEAMVKVADKYKDVGRNLSEMEQLESQLAEMENAQDNYVKATESGAIATKEQSEAFMTLRQAIQATQDKIEKLRMKDLKDHFSPVMDLINDVMSDDGGEIGKLERRISEINDAMATLQRPSFRMVMADEFQGNQMSYFMADAQKALAAAAAEARAEIEKLKHEELLRNDVLYRTLNDHKLLEEQLNELTLAQIKLTAKYALGEIGAKEYAYANGIIKDQIESVQTALRGVIPDFQLQFEALQDNVKESIEATAKNLELYQALLDTGAGAAEAAAAFDLLNLKITDLPSADQLPKLNELVAGDIASLKERQELFDKFVAGGDRTKAEIEAARNRLGLPGERKGKKPDPTLQEEIIKQYQDQNKELEDLQAALANVSALSQQAGVSEEFLTQKLKERIEGLDVYKDKMGELALTIEDAFKRAGDSLADNLADAIVEGKSLLDVFKNAFKSVLKDILSAIIKSGIQKALGGLFGGGGGLMGGGLFGGGTLLGGLFGGFLATGGATNPAKGYVVGEKGPEFFMPGTTGRVIPNDELGGGGTPPVVNFNINAIDTQTGTEFILKNKKQIEGVVNEAYHRRGKAGIV